MVRMPVTIWNMLPDNGTYRFVGFVISENLACENSRSAYNKDGPLEPDSPGSSSDTPQHSEGPEDGTDGKENLQGERPSGGRAPDGKEPRDGHRDASTSQASTASTSVASVSSNSAEAASSAAQTASNPQSSPSNAKISALQVLALSRARTPLILVSEDPQAADLTESDPAPTQNLHINSGETRKQLRIGSINRRMQRKPPQKQISE